MISATQPRYPGLADALLFQARAAGLRLRRRVLELADRSFASPHPLAARLAAAPVIVETRSPLWTIAGGAKDRALTAGKVHNLRLALGGIDGVEVPAGETFSFWKQVGRPSRARGFVDGRELREGCLIASPGGALCQLSTRSTKRHYAPTSRSSSATPIAVSFPARALRSAATPPSSGTMSICAFAPHALSALRRA
jgi:VanW like protein